MNGAKEEKEAETPRLRGSSSTCPGPSSGSGVAGGSYGKEQCPGKEGGSRLRGFYCGGGRQGPLEGPGLSEAEDEFWVNTHGHRKQCRT